MDYEGRYFPKDDEREAKEKSSKAGWIIRKVFKYIFWGICALVWGVIMYRIFTSGDAAIYKKMFFSESAVSLAEQIGDDFTVYDVQVASTMNKNGTIQTRFIYYAEDAEDFEIGLKYRMNAFTGNTDESLPFTFMLTDESGNEYELSNTVFDVKNNYGFARLCFSGVDIDISENCYIYDGSDWSAGTPQVNNDGYVLNSDQLLWFYVYYKDEQIAKLQVYSDYAILDTIDYKQGR